MHERRRKNGAQKSRSRTMNGGGAKVERMRSWRRKKRSRRKGYERRGEGGAGKGGRKEAGSTGGTRKREGEKRRVLRSKK